MTDAQSSPGPIWQGIERGRANGSIPKVENLKFFFVNLSLMDAHQYDIGLQALVDSSSVQGSPRAQGMMAAKLFSYSILRSSFHVDFTKAISECNITFDFAHEFLTSSPAVEMTDIIPDSQMGGEAEGAMDDNGPKPDQYTAIDVWQQWLASIYSPDFDEFHSGFREEVKIQVNILKQVDAANMPAQQPRFADEVDRTTFDSITAFEQLPQVILLLMTDVFRTNDEWATSLPLIEKLSGTLTISGPFPPTYLALVAEVARMAGCPIPEQ